MDENSALSCQQSVSLHCKFEWIFCVQWRLRTADHESKSDMSWVGIKMHLDRWFVNLSVGYMILLPCAMMHVYFDFCFNNLTEDEISQLFRTSNTSVHIDLESAGAHYTIHVMATYNSGKRNSTNSSSISVTTGRYTRCNYTWQCYYR